MLAKFAKPPGCSGCDLAQIGTGFAPASGPPNSPILFVGESLGYNEAMAGEAFVGAAGGLFNARILPSGGFKREAVRVHNCVNCRPPNDWLAGAPWQYSALNQCRQYLQESLDAPQLQVIVTLGDTALRSVLNLHGAEGVRVQDFHGTVHRDPTDRVWVVPTYHPSHLQRGAINLFDVVRFDLQVAQGILAHRSYTRRPVSLVLDPPVVQFEGFVAGVKERVRADPGGVWLAVDIETPDKSGGRDEGELTADDTSTEITRCNFALDEDEGWTVPYEGPYKALIDELLTSGAILFLWNKRYDESRLRFNQHTFRLSDGTPVQLWDLMWAAHHYQSDWPLGLGFWAPFASDYGAWKHLGKSEDARDAVLYAGIDGLQTRRVGRYLIERLMQHGLWDAFYRHTHLREQYVLRPAHENGCPISVDRLDKFHEKLQKVAAERLELINTLQLAGNLHPKAGYAKRPTYTKPDELKKCIKAKHETAWVEEAIHGGPGCQWACRTCNYAGGYSGDPTPPKSVLGDAGKKGDAAKQAYIEQGVRLVSREVEGDVLVCEVCGQIVPRKHNCLRPAKKRKKAEAAGEAVPADPEAVSQSTLTLLRRRQTRWYWQLPFNPDSAQQILRFIKESGQEPGRAKKTRKETTDKETLKKLYAKTGNPLYLWLLEYKAVKKVDSTYALGAKKRIWTDGRLHPLYTFRPSTQRDSYVSPNIQNVVADKDTKGVGSLAAGFRDCIVADPGYRLVELDYSGIEAVDTGWLCGDPHQIRLATLGVHAYLTAHLLHAEGKLSNPPALSWSDEDLAALFKEVKKAFPLEYDKSKRCVHGNNYGLTTFGMHNNFPEVFRSVKEAETVQQMYYGLCPQLPAYHARMRDFAQENGYLGGPYVDDYTLLVSGGYHPWGYMHWFYGVYSLRPLKEADYRRLQWIARERMNLAKHPRVVIIHGRPFEKVWGDDSKRVVAFPPQSIAAGTLKEAELMLFHPDSPDYMGEIAEGKTPLVAPIHDSLLLHVPDHVHEWVILHAAEVMRRPIPTMPMKPEWNMGSHLRINVAAKVSPVGGSWAECEEVKLPDMVPETARETLYTPADEQEWDDVEDLETPIEPTRAVA